MTSTFLITAFATLFVVIDPPGLVPMFIALTRGMNAERRRAMALRACIIAALILLLFGLAGEAVLGFIGISMPAFRIAGGILLFLTALDMLFERRTQRREGQTADPDHDPSVFPLATPLIAGPGAIATMILLVLPWLDRSPVKSIRYKGPIYKGALALFVLNFVVLGYLGTEPTNVWGQFGPWLGNVERATVVARVGTMLYFAFFVLMPWYTSIDKVKPEPQRLTW